MVVGSESLKFEAEHDAASKTGQPGADEASHMFASPRGDVSNQCENLLQAVVLPLTGMYSQLMV